MTTKERKARIESLCKRLDECDRDIIGMERSGSCNWRVTEYCNAVNYRDSLKEELYDTIFLY